MIFGTIYTIIFIVYLFSENSDVVYALYVPFDFMTTAATAAFYFYYEHLDKIQDEEKQRLKAYLDEKSRKDIMGSLTQGLKQRFSNSGEDDDKDDEKEKDRSTGIFGGSLLKSKETSVETLEKQKDALKKEQIRQQQLAD